MASSAIIATRSVFMMRLLGVEISYRHAGDMYSSRDSTYFMFDGLLTWGVGNVEFWPPVQYKHTCIYRPVEQSQAIYTSTKRQGN